MTTPNITNGKDSSFGQSSSGLPDVSQAVMGLFQPVTVGIIMSTMVDGYNQTIIEKYIYTQGVRIATNNQLVITKTGERFWAHEDVYFMANIVLKVDDLFLFNKYQYRVMSVEEWTEYGYNKYTVLQDYTKIFIKKPSVIG